MNSKLLAVLLLALLAAIVSPANGDETGSWGDQGDGTYKNPVLNGDYPDVDIERLGDTYYLITSTVTYAPGMTLLESKDLVNWQSLGHIWDKLEWEPEYNWDRMQSYGFGVWAADLAHHDGKWYCYFIDTRSGLYVSWADKITGPWSDPACMLRKTKWTDPAAFWDEEEEQAYLICNFGREHGKDPDGDGRVDNEARLFKMSWDGLKLEDEGQPIYYGNGAEAAKIYKIDGTYYIFLAEWIDGDRKQLVLRGKSLYGPLERKIVMERNPESPLADRNRSVSQGALVQVPDGSWWLTHQLVQHRRGAMGGGAGRTTARSFEGRSQWLVPVEWKDGWPVVGVDATGNGVGNTVLQSRKPIQGHPITAPRTDDEFGSATLGPQWQWNHNPRHDHWSLTERPGWLRLKAAVPVGDGGFWGAANTLSQRLTGTGGGIATAKIDIGSMQPGQHAGFCRHSGQYMLLGIHADDEGKRRLCFNRNGRQTAGPAVDQAVIYIRTENHGPVASFFYGFDGETWTRLGDEFPITFGRWRGDRLGFYCWNDKTADGHIDIDWFRYNYDGPLGGL